MPFQVTKKLQDLDNLKTFYAGIYEAFSVRNRTSIAQTKPESRKHFKHSQTRTTHPYADISLTTANIDMKLICLDRGTCALTGDTKIARFR